MKTPEQILRQDKYKDLENLVLICNAMEEYCKQAETDHEDIIKKLVIALQEICKGQGRYDMDRLRHASNTIEDMIEIAGRALDELPKKYQP